MENLNAQEKSALVDSMFESTEGRMALAASMANPIRMDMDYQGISRKVLVVDAIPQGELVVYDRDVRLPAKVIGMRGRIEDGILEGERVTVPTFNVVSYPQVPIDQIQTRKFNIVDRAQQRAKNDMMATEDTFLFTALEAAAASGINGIATVAGTVDKDALLNVYQEVGKWPLNPAKIVMNFVNYVDLLRFTRDEIDPVTQREVLMTGLWAHIWTTDILVSNLCPVNRVFVIAEPEQTGVLPIRQDITVTPSDIMPRLTLGWVIYETIGMGILNPRSVAKLEVSGKTTFTPWYLSNTIGEAIYTPNGSIS